MDTVPRYLLRLLSISVERFSIARRVQALIHRVAYAFSLVAGVVLFGFILFNLIPGDPARVILGPNASEEAVQSLLHQLGYDRPPLIRFKDHIYDIVNFDLGESVVTGQDVFSLVLDRFLVTATIGLSAIILSLLFSYFVNLLSFTFHNFHYIVGLISALLVVPPFATALILGLSVAAFWPGLVTDPSSINPPILGAILVASVFPTAYLTAILNNQLLKVVTGEHYKAALLRNLSNVGLFHREIFRPNIVVWLAAATNLVSVVFFSTFLIEVVFSLPGSGTLLLKAIQTRDFPLLNGILVINACFFILIGMIANSSYKILDPRIVKASK